MKFLVVFVCFLAAVHGLPPIIMQQIQEIIGETAGRCRTEVGASDDDVAPIKARRSPTTHAGKCFLSCMQKNFGLLDKSGKIDKEGTYALINKLQGMDDELYGQMKHVADSCIAKVTESPDVCDTAFHMYKCVKKESKAAGIKVPILNF